MVGKWRQVKGTKLRVQPQSAWSTQSTPEILSGSWQRGKKGLSRNRKIGRRNRESGISLGKNASIRTEYLGVRIGMKMMWALLNERKQTNDIAIP